ncbi:MAG: TatD family hydrolase [Clostridia bacterium]|nr:TatD family hydrolase [Clostridia bacterium]
MLFDSHAHYNDSHFDNDRFEILESMQENNVGYIMNISDSMKSVLKVLDIAKRYSFVYASVGVHPEETAELCEADMELLEEYTKNPKVKAIGEIGLDYYWDSVPRDVQKKWFVRQIELAKKVNLPVVIHDRDAHGDCMDILRSENVRDVGGILHCYSGSVEMAKEILDFGMYIAFGGTLTFKNARKVREVAEYVPLDRIVIETDCPYLAPEPHRGKRNSSLYIHYVAEKLAEIKGISYEEAERVTCRNAKRCYRIED